MDLEIAGKTVIVTGGSGGIGKGLLLEYAREGCNVICAGRDQKTGEATAKLAEKQGFAGKIVAIKTDVTDRASVDAMVAEANKIFGPIDILVNNAGGASHPDAFENLTRESRDFEIQLNIDGVVNCCQAVAEDMLSRRKGSIVNISSTSSLLGEAANNMVHYGSTKGFVNSFSKALAWEWAKKGVRVNTLCPGWIVPYEADDVGEGSFWRKYGFDLMGKPDEMQEHMEKGTLFNMSSLPMPRLGRPEDIAWTSMFLSSDRAGYVTGQMITVSGGQFMH